MNGTAICLGMPVLPIGSYWVLSWLGVTSAAKVVVPAMFTVAYVLAVTAVIIKKVADEGSQRKEQ